MRKKREHSFITIKDVAEEANVSIATVSRVINEGKVSERRKKQVLDAIKKLDYVPNNSARNLASVNSTKRIALILPTIQNYCYSQLITGFKTGCKLYKYDPIIEEYGLNEMNYEFILDNFDKSSEIKGIIQIGPYEKLDRKVVIDIFDHLIEYDISSYFTGKKIGVYFENDDYLSQYFTDCVFKTNQSENISPRNIRDSLNNDIYITQNINQAAKLVNLGVKEDIFILDNINEVSKLIPNFKQFDFDFYKIGIGLSRIMIKHLTGRVTEDDSPLVIEVQGEINEK